jgi:hypothetical protein
MAPPWHNRGSFPFKRIKILAASATLPHLPRSDFGLLYAREAVAAQACAYRKNSVANQKTWQLSTSY